MAEALSGDLPQESAREDEAVLGARRRAEQKVPRHRFGIAYLGLALILGAAVGLIVVFAAHGGRGGGTAWSPWKPTDKGVQGLDQIARHVGGQYGLPNGHPLVGVLSTPPVVQGQSDTVPVRAIGVTTGLPGETLSDAEFYDASSAWAYVLCGLGKQSSAEASCAIPEGSPTTQRFDLLRREALELALYTFKYDSGVDSVVTYMPPAPGKQTNTVLFFRRDTAKPALSTPLASTLPVPAKRLVPGHLNARDRDAIRRYATSNVFQFQYQQIPDGTAIMVLQPVA